MQMYAFEVYPQMQILPRSLLLSSSCETVKPDHRDSSFCLHYIYAKVTVTATLNAGSMLQCHLRFRQMNAFLNPNGVNSSLIAKHEAGGESKKRQEEKAGRKQEEAGGGNRKQEEAGRGRRKRKRKEEAGPL